MKHILLIMLGLIIPMSLNAKDRFYYSGGKKIPLTVQSGKSVLISKKAAHSPYNSSIDNTIKVINDTALDIKVIDSSVKALSKKMKSVSNVYHIESCYRSKNGRELYPTGYINLELKKAMDYGILEKTASDYNLEIVSQNRFMPLWYSLRIGEGTIESVIDIANDIYETGLFSSCSPDFSFDASEISYDPYVSYQWGLYNPEYLGIDISVSEAWNYSTGRGIKIAIIDNGVDVDHQDLVDNIYRSYDFTKNDSPTSTYGDHGTHCAGIAAAVRNNGIQIAGVAPDAKIMAAGIDYNGSNPLLGFADGINWAWKNGADIISCSWGACECDLIKRAIDDAVTKGREGKGCVFVKSAGNDNDSITFPGSYRKEIITVASIDNSGIRENTCCFGNSMFISAPGDHILSTIDNNEVGYMSGSSMACPHVSGIAALILSINSSLSSNEVREIIAKSTKRIGYELYDTVREFGYWNKWYGYGLVNASLAVQNTPRF